MPQHVIIAGNQKCGTTALFDILKDHPEIAVPQDGRKELHFFNRIDRLHWYNRRKYTQRWSHEDRRTKRACLEATPVLGYYSAPHTPCCLELVKEFNPDTKIIMMFRNPVDRAYSHWNMEFNRGATDLDFEQALLHEKRQGSFDMVYSFLDRGR